MNEVEKIKYIELELDDEFFWINETSFDPSLKKVSLGKHGFGSNKAEPVPVTDSEINVWRVKRE